MFRRLRTLIIEKPSGRTDIPADFGDFGDRRIGEIWFAHPDGDAAPIMVKFLFTSQRLSIQVHPDDAAARKAGDGKKLVAVTKELRALQAELEQQYALQIVNAPGEQSATERLWTDDKGTRASGYFVFVDAVDEQGNPVKVPIRNRETDEIEVVSRWGEQVPKKVFDRLARDKQQDGVLDERMFGEKPRGTREFKVELKGDDDQPIERRGQITSWN